MLVAKFKLGALTEKLRSPIIDWYQAQTATHRCSSLGLVPV